MTFTNIDVPNLNWMKSVTQAEADSCLQKLGMK